MDLATLQGMGADLLYEDDVLSIVVPKQGAVKGHVIVYPKNVVATVDGLAQGEFTTLCQAANYIAAMMFETMGAHGTNILLVEEKPHLHLDVIARSEGDDLDLEWKAKTLGAAEMKDVEDRIKDKTFGINHVEEKNAPPPAPKEELKPKQKEGPVPAKPAEQKTAAAPAAPPTPLQKKLDDHEAQENYLIRQLIRIP